MAFWDGINTRINNIKAQQKAFEVDKTYFKPERAFDRQVYFPKQNFKTGKDFQKSPQINARGTKINMQNRYTRKQGTS